MSVRGLETLPLKGLAMSLVADGSLVLEVMWGENGSFRGVYGVGMARG